MQCKYIGRRPETTSNGRPLTTGDTFDADMAHHHDRWLLESGRAIEIPTDDKLTGKDLDDRCRELKIDGWSQMTADQRRDAVKAAENGGQHA